MRLLLRILAWAAFLIFACFVALFGSWLLVPDESLQPEAEALLARPDMPPDEENAYFLIWGMAASPELDPHVVGQQIVAEHERLVNAGQKLDGFSPEAYLGPSPLPRPELNARCTLKMESCLGFYQENATKVSADVERYIAYLDRYRRLRHYPRFSERVMSPMLASPFLEYGATLAISDLVDADIALHLSSAATPEEAFEELAAEIDLWRNILKQSDTLITQMIAVSVLQRKYRLSSEIMQAYPESVRQHVSIFREITRPLAPEETNLARALAGEFRFTSHFYRTLDLSQLAHEGEKTIFVSILGGLQGAAYKPNATVNLAYAMYKENVDFLTQSPREILSRRDSFAPTQTDVDPWSASVLFYNPVGKVLVGIAAPDFSEYALRLHDLMGYSRLLEIQRRIIEENVTDKEFPAFLQKIDAELTDPYTGRPMELDMKTHSLSFAGYGKWAKEGRVQIELHKER